MGMLRFFALLLLRLALAFSLIALVAYGVWAILHWALT